MFINCHECGKSFDALTEGYSSQYVSACAECWQVETDRRAIGGVFSRVGA